MSPLFRFKSEQDARKERIELLAVRAINEVRYDPGIRTHPWFVKCMFSIIDRVEPGPKREAINDQLDVETERMLVRITARIVNELRERPDAEEQLQRFLEPGGRVFWVQELRERFGVSIGSFVAQQISDLHQRFTGVPFMSSLDEHWQ